LATIKEVLASSELFKGLTDDELQKVANISRVEIYEKGSTLFTESSTADDLYIIELGKVAMEMGLTGTPGIGKQATVETVTKGGGCGWSALSGTPVYTLTARAIEPVRAIAIDARQLYNILKEDPYLGYRVMSRMATAISARLRNIRMTLRMFHR
jgi:CRP/FNR family cyclic AMP-dependent transcriptional regulator